MNKTNNLAILYARKSLNGSNTTIDAKDSIEDQMTRLRRYCDGAGLVVVDTIEDPDTSGNKALAKRGEGRRLIELTKKKVATNIVSKCADRIFRNSYDAHYWYDEWERKGISLHLAEDGAAVDTSTPGGFLSFSVKIMMADYERRQIVHRTKTSMRHHQANGKRMSKICPYGWVYDMDSEPNDVSDIPSLMVEDPYQQAVIARVVAWKEEGLSYGAIVKRLTDDDVRPLNKTWNRPLVRKILIRAGLVKP